MNKKLVSFHFQSRNNNTQLQLQENQCFLGKEKSINIFDDPNNISVKDFSSGSVQTSTNTNTTTSSGNMNLYLLHYRFSVTFLHFSLYKKFSKRMYS